MTEETHFQMASPSVSTRLAGDRGAMLFDADTGREKAINAVGAFIWARMDGSRNLDDLAGELREYFDDVPLDQMKDDLSAFLTEIETEGFVRSLEEPLTSGTILPVFPNLADAPESLDLSLTGKCNLNCAYCFYHDEMKARPDLPAGELLRFFQELGRLAIRDVCLSGGEIFVRPDLWELIDGIIANRMRYSILTNGTLITNDTLARFEQGHRRRRLKSLQVSIDGSCAQVHDASRGKGSFEKAIRGLCLLKDAGFPVTVRVTVNRYNVEDLDNIARLLLDEIGLDGFGTNDAMPMGAGCDHQKAIVLTPRQQVESMETLSRLADHYDGRITATAGPLAKFRMYRQMEHARATGERAESWTMGYLTACGCVFSKLSVHHDGVITPCNMLAGLTLGRINQDRLTEIWKTHPMLQALKDRRKIPMTQVPGCGDCEWAAFCNGGCPGLAYEMTGDVNRVNPHDCYQRFLRESGNPFGARP